MGASGLGSLLVKEGLLTEQDRLTINRTCGQGSWAFAKSILTMGLLDEEELAAFVAERTRFRVAAKNFLQRFDAGIAQRVDGRMCSRLEILPLSLEGHRLTVAVADPLDKATLAQLEFFTGFEIVPLIAPLSQIYEGLTRLNPEFKPRFSALSNFLRNHAAGAWVKQKVYEEADELDEQIETRQHGKKSRADKKRPVDPETFAASRSDDFDENGPEDEFESQNFKDLDDDLDLQLSEDLPESSSAPSKAVGATAAEPEDAWASELEDDDLDAIEPPAQQELQGLDELDLDASLENEGLDAFDSMSLEDPSGLDESSSEERAEMLSSEAEPAKAGLEDDPFGSFDSDFPELSETPGTVESEQEAATDDFPTEEAGEELNELGLEADDPLDSFSQETEPADTVAAEDSSLEEFSFEETAAESIEDNSGTQPDALPSELLLASLDQDLSDAIDSDGDAGAIDFEVEDSGDEQADFDDRPGLSILEASLASANSEIIDGTPGEAGFEEVSTEATASGSIPATAHVNELLLRISLCFSTGSLCDLLDEKLPSLCAAGAFILSTGEGQRLFAWSAQKSLSATERRELSVHLQKWQAGHPSGTWQEVDLSRKLQQPGSYRAIWKPMVSGLSGCIWAGVFDKEDQAFLEALEALLDQLATRAEEVGLKVG